MFQTGGWVSLTHLHDICPRVGKLQVARADLLEVASEKDRPRKLRFETKPGVGEDVPIRVFQGQSFGPIRTGATLKSISHHGLILRATTRESLPIILNEGLKVTERNAMHFAHRCFSARQRNYVTTRKSPYILVIDADGAIRAEKRAFFCHFKRRNLTRWKHA